MRRLLVTLLLVLAIASHADGQVIGQSQAPFPSLLASVSITNSTASIINQTLLASTPASPASQHYRVSIYMVCTTAGSGNNQLSITRTDDILGALTSTYIFPVNCTAFSFSPNVRTFRSAASSAITFSTTYTATGTWALTVTLERLY